MKKSDQLNVNDYAQQYDETYCLFRNLQESSSTPVLMYIQNSHASPSGKTRAEFVDVQQDLMNVLEVYHPAHEIIHFQPKQGLYNVYRKNTVFLRKHGNKQYKKGFGPNLYIATSGLNFALREAAKHTSFEYNENGNKELLHTFWQRANILALVRDPFPSLYEAFELLDTTEAIALALSTNWQIVLSRDPKYPYELYHGQMPVGYFSDREHVVIDQLFKQEFSDFLRSKGIHLNVKEA